MYTLNTFTTIKYVDAQYIDWETIETKDMHLGIWESVGYVRENKEGDLVIEYFKDMQADSSEVLEGIVIPKGSVIGQTGYDKNLFKDLIIGKMFEVLWKDLARISAGSEVSCSRMSTSGVLHMIADDFLIIKDPIPMRLQPLPIKNHPSFTPFYYVIPKSSIIKIEKHDK